MSTEVVSAAPEARRKFEFSQVAVGGALLLGATLSVTLSVLQRTAPSVTELVATNALALPRRMFVIKALAIASLLPIGYVVWALFKAPRPGELVLRSGKLLSPLLVTAFLPSLFARGPWKGQELQYLAILAIAGLVLEQLLTVSLSEMNLTLPQRLSESARFQRLLRWLRHAPFVIVCAGVLYYAILISYYTLISHIRITTSTADLGEYDNQFFNSLHGHPFRLPASEGDLTDWSALKFHADFIIYVLLPIYAIKPGPEILLILQTVLIALTAIPIYLFGARRLPRWMAAIVALAFLMLPVVQRPNFYDFHAPPIGCFFAAWVIWAVDRVIHSEAPKKREYVVLWLAFILACLSREDIAFGMVIVSLVVLFYGKAPKLAGAMLATSLGYFVLIKFVIMPRVGVSWYDTVYDQIKAAGATGYGAVVMTLITNPVFVLRSMLNEAKLLFMLHMTAPLLFLWLRRPYLLVAAVPSVFFTLMVTNRPAMFMSSFQYTYQWLPYIVIASIIALERIGAGALRGPVKQKAAALALALVAAGAGYQYGVLLGGKAIIGGYGEKRLEVTPADLSRYHDLKSLTRQIPPEASVAATETEGPHVSTRLVLYNIRYGLGDKPDYLLFNRGLDRVQAKRVLAVLESREYGVVEQRGQFVLARRGHDPAKNAGVVDELRRR